MTSVIVSGARTPMGRLLGNLKDVPATKLGSVAIEAALAGPGVAPEQVQYVIMGQVLQAGAGQMPARQAAVGAGIPMSTPSLTINKVCLSGLDAIALADQLIRAGEFDIVVAGGMESMTNAPHLLTGSRGGLQVRRRDDGRPHGLRRAHRRVRATCSMGESTDRPQRPARRSAGRSRTRSAPRSHQLAAAAQKNGAFAEEITPVAVPQRTGRAGAGHRGRGRAARHHGRVAGQAAPGLRRRRHHHRRHVVADLRRRRARSS